MSTNFPTRPEMSSEPAQFAIVASEYNRDYVDGLVRHAVAELEIVAPKSTVSTVRVPGSFEIPIAVQSVAMRVNPAAILAFGVIFDGETLHASLIATAVTEALLNIGLKHEIPILHEVLVVKNDEQARIRCLAPEINRGTEAARAAVRIVQTLQQIRKGG
jgi:6,7-dimethyl-8-ribityllumazine synthase